MQGGELVHESVGPAPLLLVQGAFGLAQPVEGAGQHVAVLPIDGDLAEGEEALHLAARLAAGGQLGHPVPVAGKGADQIGAEAIDDAEVVADGEAVVHHLLRLLGDVELLVHKLAGEAIEEHLVSHGRPLLSPPPG
ncbi:hypothetical protein D3C81_1692130 [compost metagenome]